MTMINVGINGFGRIGRIAARLILTKYQKQIKLVAINTSGSMPIEGWVHLLEYDSVYGKFDGRIKINKDFLEINGQKIIFTAECEPINIPWGKYQVETVIESTGVFRDRKSVAAHLEAGAKKVIVTAPADKIDTFVIGVNDDQYRNNLIINNASCTTNCVAPVTKVILENLGIQKAFITTVHAVTADQELVDGSHSDLRRGRSAMINIVPTSTGAAIATTQVLPSLKGIFDGLAIRVPVICGSLADFTFLTTKRTSKDEVNKLFIQATKNKYKNIIEVSDQPLVSADIIGNTASAIVDLNLTQVIDGDLVKVIAWYDNEWGYCCRLIEEVLMISKK